MDENDAPYQDLLNSVVDGAFVDWPQLEQAATTDQEREFVRKLRLIAAIQAQGAAHSAGSAPPGRDTHVRVVEDRLNERVHVPYLSGEQESVRWGRLTLRERIGEGVYAEVYRAVELGSSREVALKLFWPSTRSSDALLQRALQEARSLSSVKHPGVAAVHYVESNNERLGMCCEFVRGQTLAHLLHLQGRFSAWEACVVGIQLCGALAAVHDAGFLHRDVKTFNVMREEGGRIVLMDFGAAQAIDRVSHHAAGTPLYLAPEVADGRTATIRSDLYSVGVLLFNLVTDSTHIPDSPLTKLSPISRGLCS